MAALGLCCVLALSSLAALVASADAAETPAPQPRKPATPVSGARDRLEADRADFA